MLQCNYIDGCLEMVFCSCLMENETVQHRMDSTYPRPGVGAYMFWAVFQKGKKIMKMENLVVDTILPKFPKKPQLHEIQKVLVRRVDSGAPWQCRVQRIF